MSWIVRPRSSIFKYYVNEDEFSSIVKLGNHNFSKENSSGYQEPDDDVLDSIFFAETEHGYFEWSVRSVRKAFNSYAEIEDESMTKQPEDIDNYEDLEFIVVNG